MDGELEVTSHSVRISETDFIYPILEIITSWTMGTHACSTQLLLGLSFESSNEIQCAGILAIRCNHSTQNIHSKRKAI